MEKYLKSTTKRVRERKNEHLLFYINFIVLSLIFELNLDKKNQFFLTHRTNIRNGKIKKTK